MKVYELIEILQDPDINKEAEVEIAMPHFEDLDGEKVEHTKFIKVTDATDIGNYFVIYTE